MTSSFSMKQGADVKDRKRKVHDPRSGRVITGREICLVQCVRAGQAGLCDTESVG